MVIGVTGAFYMQHRASVMATGSIPNAPQTAVQAATAPPETPKDLPPLDAQVWEAIRNSTNPADYEAYLRLFPTGAVADLARQRLWVLTPASPPPVSTTEPIPAAPKPKPQQKEAAATPTPAPQQQASAAAPTSAATSKKEATTKTFPSPIPDREVPATTGASASTTPTPVPQRQAGAAAPTSAAAPIATPQQQALNAPDVSKSVTSSPSPNAPYDGEWKGFILAYSCPGGGMASCGGDMTVRVANNAVSGTFEGAFGKRSLSGNIAGDGSFIGNLENAPASGKFDKDRFRGVVSSSPQPGSISGAVLLERVK